MSGVFEEVTWKQEINQPRCFTPHNKPVSVMVLFSLKVLFTNSAGETITSPFLRGRCGSPCFWAALYLSFFTAPAPSAPPKVAPSDPHGYSTPAALSEQLLCLHLLRGCRSADQPTPATIHYIIALVQPKPGNLISRRLPGNRFLEGSILERRCACRSTTSPRFLLPFSSLQLHGLKIIFLGSYWTRRGLWL